MDQLTDELRYGLIKLHALTENMLKNEFYTKFGAREYLRMVGWSNAANYLQGGVRCG